MVDSGDSGRGQEIVVTDGLASGRRMGRRSLGVLNPPSQTPRPLGVNPLVSGGITRSAWKAE
nr:hypothetical protein [Kibdelosporangium sp. MJ126-NF4]CTQ88274.1 hypothetical protein [Kibdelosporangium sp. MJ126-NF4]